MDGISFRTLPRASCLSLLHRGPYDQLGRSYARILDEARRRQANVQLPTREVYIKGPGMIFKGNPRELPHRDSVAHRNEILGDFAGLRRPPGSNWKRVDRSHRATARHRGTHCLSPCSATRDARSLAGGCTGAWPGRLKPGLPTLPQSLQFLAPRVRNAAFRRCGPERNKPGRVPHCRSGPGGAVAS